MSLLGMPRRQFARFALVGIGGLLLAAAALGNAAGNIFSKTNPERALRFDPRNADALAALATLRNSSGDNSPNSRNGALELAKRALRQGPILASAMRALSLSSASQNKTEQSVAQIQIAQSLSRRDLPTQLTLIELCVARGDIRCALSHYDVALSTSNANAAPLFPTLSAALSSPDIVRGIVRYIKSDRPWADDFMAYVAANGDPTAGASVIIANNGLPNTPLNRESGAVLLGRLAAAQRWDLVHSTYDALEGRGLANAPMLGFSRKTVDTQRLPVSWEILSNGSMSADFEPFSKGYRLHVTTSSGVGGDVPVARRALFLAPGSTHILSMHVDSASLAPNSAIGLSLACAPASQAKPLIWRQARPKAAIYDWRFTVPTACSAQQLELFIGGDANQTDGDITIRTIALRSPSAPMRNS